MRKSATLLLIAVLVLSSLIMVNSAFAQSIPKPSVPEFTVEYFDNSYDIAPTYTTDPYTNNTVIQTRGDHVDNRTVVVTIKNQPFTPFTDKDGNTINLFYSVRYKGTFGQEWTSMFGERAAWEGVYDPYGTYGFPTQDASSQHTTITYSLPWNIVDGKMDIQVEALEGYTNRTIDPSRSHINWVVYEYTFYGKESGWSNTTTITLGPLPSASPSPPVSPEPTTNPIDLPQEALYAIVIASIIIVIVLLVYIKKHEK
jgi:hypothetical protein